MRTRYRVQTFWFRKPLLVLQIAEESKRGQWVDIHPDITAPPNWDPDEDILTWEDAKVEDLTDLSYLKTGADNG